MNREKQRIKIGELLLGNGFITHDQLDEALDVQQTTGELLGMILLNRGYISKEILHTVLTAQTSPN